MKLRVIFLVMFSICVSASREGLPLLNPGGIGGIFAGPDSETIIIGPDGSEIVSEQKGGSVTIEDDALAAQPIVVAETPLQIVAKDPIISSTPLPLLTGQGPVLVATSAVEAVPKVEIEQQDPHIVETEIIEAPDVEPEQNSDLQGPSGRIITKGSASIVSGPASTTITEPRKVVVLPPKLSIPIAQKLAIPVLSSTAPPVDLSYSTVLAPALSSTAPYYESSKIDLGEATIGRSSIPVVEYSASNGVVGGLISSTPAPQLLVSEAPAQYLEPPIPIQNGQYVSSTLSPNIQKIPKFEEAIVAADGRVDNMADLYYAKLDSRSSYRLPKVLSMALERFYRKVPVKNKDSVVINDKMGDLSQNEISNDGYSSPPDLSLASLVAPALAKEGIEASAVNLANVPLSQVTRIAESGYYPQGLASNRYQRQAEVKN